MRRLDAQQQQRLVAAAQLRQHGRVGGGGKGAGVVAAPRADRALHATTAAGVANLIVATAWRVVQQKQ
jgi:hypothetical protein